MAYKDKNKQKEYYIKNKTKILKRQREYYQENAEIIKKKAKKYRQDNLENHGRKYHLSKYFNMSVEEYDKLFQQQKGVCAICGKEEIIKNQHGIRRLVVDHNHLTGKVRGLLCGKCNAALGLLDIDKSGVTLLLSSIDYIKRTI